MEELEDFTLLGYIDDMEGVVFYAKKNNMTPGTIKGIEGIHGTLVDLAPFIKSEKDVKRLSLEVGGLIDELKSNCQKGDERGALGMMRTLRDKVNGLKAQLSA